MNSRFCLTVLSLVCLPILALAGPACSSSNSTASVVVTQDGGPGAADASSTEDAPTGGGTQCTTARDQLLLPIDKTSTGVVSIISESNGTRTIYVDASAGGISGAAKSPRIYIDLEAAKKVDVTDKTAPESTAWDLALKRQVIFTNSGDTGIGIGGAIQINKSFASVSDDDANAASLEKEILFSEECEARLDPTGAPNTTFADWYDYDQTTNIPSPKNVTYVVRGGTGKKYKVGIKAYQGLPDGGTGMAGANFVLQVTAL